MFVWRQRAALAVFALSFLSMVLVGVDAARKRANRARLIRLPYATQMPCVKSIVSNASSSVLK